MHQPPFAILKSKDVRNPVRPLCRPIHVGHARIEGLDIGGVGQLRCHHGRDIFITDSAALELMTAINYGDIVVAVGGTPIGTFEEDARVIDLSIPSDDLSERSQARRQQMLMLIDKLTNGLSVLTAHVMGHSVGLVPPGHPPDGFFAGETRAAFKGKAELLSF